MFVVIDWWNEAFNALSDEQQKSKYDGSSVTTADLDMIALRMGRFFCCSWSKRRRKEVARHVEHSQ